jgi:ribosomal protein S5
MFPSAIGKAVEDAKKNLVRIPIVKGNITSSTKR